MANSSINESVFNSELCEVCSNNMSWTFLLVVVCLTVCCVICQITFAIVVGQDKSCDIQLQQALFVIFHFIFLTSYSIAYILQQSGHCGWMVLGDTTCKFIAWSKNFSFFTCNCLLLFSWNHHYGYIKYRLFSFRYCIICAILTLGVLAVPYILYTHSIHRTVADDTAMPTVCELSASPGTAVEIIEVVCGTVILSSLVVIRIIKDFVARMASKNQPVEENSSNRRYSRPPPPEAISSAKDKLNSRRVFQLNVTVSISYLILVIPQRYFEFILFLAGSRQTVQTLCSKNKSGLEDYNWRILVAFFTVMPLLHGISVLLSYIATKAHAIKLFRRRASKPIKRRVPIRQHTDTNFCKSIEEVSDHGIEENNETSNGSPAVK